MADLRKKVELATRELVLTNDQLEKVSSLLLNEFNEGLRRETNAFASVKMFPTFVRDVSNGKEEGKYLALDLGGTNFRVLLIELHGDQFLMDNQIFSVPQQIMLGSGEELFDHIAQCLASFMEQKNVKQYKLALGFTFSFPCVQQGLTKARLVSWTKGFNCSGVEGEDVVQLLRNAIKRRGVRIDYFLIVIIIVIVFLEINQFFYLRTSRLM
jgi:hexokinase